MTKKVVAILLALIMTLAFVGCTMTEEVTAEKIKAEYKAFDWQNASEASAKMEAEKLLTKIKSLDASMQQEVSDIKTELDKIIAGNDVEPTPSTTPTPTPTLTPGENPDGTLPKMYDPNANMPESNRIKR